MIRAFFILWFLLTAAWFAWMWLAGKEEKTLVKVWAKRAALSAIVSIACIGGLLLFNNISGV